jgi:ribonuclease HI
MNPYALKIYTDGSSKVHLNCDAGCAFVVVYPEHVGVEGVEEYGKSYDQSKIGAMEIQGINQALIWLCKEEKRLKKMNINTSIIYCDNQYVVNASNNWAFSWADNKWKKKSGGDVANIIAWKEYMKLRRKTPFRVEIKYIKGKTTPETKMADKKAKKFADSIPKYKNNDFMFSKMADKLDSSQLIKETCPNIKKVIIRIYYHQPVNKTKNSEYKVYFEIIKKEVVVGSYIAFCTKEFDKKYIDRKNYYIASFEQRDKNYTIFTNTKRITGERLSGIKSKMRKNYGKC